MEYKGNANSSTNQQIKERFVNQNVICNVTHELNYILNKSWEDSDAPYSWDEFDNYDIDEGEEYPEVFEFWKVSSFLGGELKKTW